jgi:hypothetical protein
LLNIGEDLDPDTGGILASLDPDDGGILILT